MTYVQVMHFMPGHDRPNEECNTVSVSKKKDETTSSSGARDVDHMGPNDHRTFYDVIGKIHYISVT